MKKLVSCLLALLLLAGCRSQVEQRDLSMISDVSNPVEVYEMTPEQTTFHVLAPEALEQINAQLQSVQAVAVRDWKPGLTRWVIDYGYPADGTRCIWSPPYWITPDGTAYRTDLALEFGDEWELSAHVWDRVYPLGGYFAALHDGKTLDPAFLKKIEFPEPGQRTIRITGVQADRIDFTCSNCGSGDWEMNQIAQLLAELDGQWYLVPPNFEPIRDLVGISLSPGGSYEKSLSLAPYPNLPKGRYAVLFDGVWDTFEIQ